MNEILFLSNEYITGTGHYAFFQYLELGNLDQDAVQWYKDKSGHGWMHKALVCARLKDGDGVVSSLLLMMAGSGYYTSLMTDHDTTPTSYPLPYNPFQTIRKLK